MLYIVILNIYIFFIILFCSLLSAPLLSLSSSASILVFYLILSSLCFCILLLSSLFCYSSVLLTYFALFICCLLICFFSIYTFLLSLPILSLSQHSNWITCLLCYIGFSFITKCYPLRDFSLVCSSDCLIGYLLSKPFLLLLVFNSHICNLIFIISLIVHLLLSFMYFFLPHLSFFIVQHFVFPAIYSFILFFTFDITFSFTCFFHIEFFYLLLCLFQFPRFRLFVVLLCRECSCNSFFFLFFHYLLDFSFFISIFCIMMQHDCCVLYSLFCRSYSCFYQNFCV